LSERWRKTLRWFKACAAGFGAKGCSPSKLVSGKDETTPTNAKFRDYFDYDEPVGRVPSHRALAVSGTEIRRCWLPEPPLPAVLRHPKAKWCRSPKEIAAPVEPQGAAG
jgi:uncharacterized protein